jgi:hypothetical protein
MLPKGVSTVTPEVNEVGTVQLYREQVSQPNTETL